MSLTDDEREMQTRPVLRFYGESRVERLDQLDTVSRLQELSVPPGNRLEVLRGDRQGQHSIRINQQYRIVFAWISSGPSAVTIVDYH